MDEFGVLVESIGFKSQVKSTPLADLKSKNNKINNGFPRYLGIHSGFDSKSSPVYNSNSINGSFNLDLDGIFRSTRTQKDQNFGNFDGFDDVFGGPINTSKPSAGGDGFDLDSIFKGSNNFGVKSTVYNIDDDDIFGGIARSKSLGSGNYDDVFGSIASPSKQSAQVDDLLGDFGGMGLRSNGSGKKSEKVEKNAREFDDLIPGFGGSSHSRNGGNSESSWSTLSSGHSAKSTSTSVEDPFVIFESSQKGRFETSAHDFDSVFSMGNQPWSQSMPKSPTADPVFDSLFQNKGGPRVSQTSSSTKKASPQTNIGDEFSFLFGDEPSSREFQEIKGESVERRRARLNHHMRTQERMANALAEKNQRDFQTQQEQEERHRIAETLDDNIKRWAAGKEGNLRALLSSLQYVLWPECGWKPVSLTDLITSISVKKVYHRATLCVHPDKVQQKGANVQQKYTAEKVFDLLKEAWNKFNSEEL
ncbi:hypothetical protein ACSBR2_001340 [Camellia fascicularis]